MVRNPQRRAELVDAAITVLATEGARGLTFRAVDETADVPPGTASNYFANRDDLFTQAGARINVRVAPDPSRLADSLAGTTPRDSVAGAMRELAERIASDHTGYLAMQELRLEATRRPALRTALTRTVRATVEEGLASYDEARLPGGRDVFLVLYLAMTGLLLEQLTLPEVLDTDTATVIDTVVDQIVP